MMSRASAKMPLNKSEKALLSKKELLKIFVDRRVDSPFPGDWESVFKGSGYEFWSLRELEPFDPLRGIDWKATARTGTYHVREYLAESYVNVMILYDISKSVAFGRKELLQANIAVSLAYTAAMGNNGCGMILFADDVVHYLPPKMGWSHFRQIVSTLAQAEPLACSETSLNHAVRKLVGELTGSLTFILSDFLYPIECEYSFHRTLHGTNKHEVKALQILETFERQLPPDSSGLMYLHDLESGRREWVDLGKWQAHNRYMQQVVDQVRRRLARCGIDSVVITPEDDFCRKINDLVSTRP